MDSKFPLLPEQASTLAGQVDDLYFFLIAVSLFFSVLIFGLVAYFAIKYRRRSELEMPRPIIGSVKLELFWTVIPLVIAMGIFVWGTTVYYRLNRPPSDTLDFLVVAKQWMWKIQHPQGRREINTLHVPVGQPVKLTMTSEDTIHSFFVPAFRVKMDVLPGRYTTVWFEAIKTGKYHLFCAEYCGTGHSKMGGWVYVMEPTAYQQWLGGGSPGEPLRVSGEKLFAQFRCNTCHFVDASGRGPALVGLLGKRVQLVGGQTLMADEAYVRESILNPSAKTVAGYKQLMPTFQGQISETGLLQIIAYIKSLGPERKGPAPSDE
ncbi:MAG: cytochrome c oxidase subunit II [Acidobacteriota bacterium]